jgi:hypothetical protein
LIDLPASLLDLLGRADGRRIQALITVGSAARLRLDPVAALGIRRP